MKHKHLKILVIFDVAGRQPADQDFTNELKTEEWKTEADVVHALKALGHEVHLLGVYDDMHLIIDEVKRLNPDLVFNLIENFHGVSHYDVHVAGLFQLLKVPSTGTSPSGLMLCKNKGVAKEILSYHRIKTPAFKVIHRREHIRPSQKMTYPILIKPLREEASYGISHNSLVHNHEEFIERVKFLHESLSQDALAEEYIVGRELYVSLLGNERPRVFPFRELLFQRVDDEEHKIATFKAKWDEKYRKRHGIKNVFADELPKEVVEKITKICKRVYRLLEMSGYGRIDLRLTPKNDIVILEANPNPHIAKEEDFAMAAAKVGWGYERLIAQILKLGMANPL